MNCVAELPTKDTITLVINRKNVDKVTYVFKNEYGNKIGEYENKSPATLSSQSNIAKQFKQLIDPKGDLKPNRVNNQFAELKTLLQLNYENGLSVIEQEKADLQQAKQEKDTAKSKKAITKLKSLEQPLTYFGSLIEWFTAGERNNIVYAFTVYAGQVILRNPVSVICLGEAGSGQNCKAANQVAIAGTVVGVAESIIYSMKSGLDPKNVLDAISKGAAGSWQMQNNGYKMIKNDYSPGFFNKHFIKDMKIAQEVMKEKGQELPVLNKVLEMYEILEKKGITEEGTQSIIKYYLE